jgi:hypothetical protein
LVAGLPDVVTINDVLVGAAGVEPTCRIENTYIVEKSHDHQKRLFLEG